MATLPKWGDPPFHYRPARWSLPLLGLLVLGWFIYLVAAPGLNDFWRFESAKAIIAFAYCWLIVVGVRRAIHNPVTVADSYVVTVAIEVAGMTTIGACLIQSILPRWNFHWEEVGAEVVTLFIVPPIVAIGSYVVAMLVGEFVHAKLHAHWSDAAMGALTGAITPCMVITFATLQGAPDKLAGVAIAFPFVAAVGSFAGIRAVNLRDRARYSASMRRVLPDTIDEKRIEDRYSDPKQSDSLVERGDDSD